MNRLRTGLIAASIGAALPSLGCSSSANGPPSLGAVDGARPDSAPGDRPRDAVEAGPNSACDDSLPPTPLLGDGFEAWEGLAILGCLNPADPTVAVTACDDGIVTGGSFTVQASVCTGHFWDVHIFDGSRGLDCITTEPPIGGVFTVTPADCTCASPGGAPSDGCNAGSDGGADGNAAPDAIPDAPEDGSG
jgi:hypothetical protein